MGLNQLEAKISDYSSMAFALLQGARMGQVTTLFLIWHKMVMGYMYVESGANKHYKTVVGANDYVVSCFVELGSTSLNGTYTRNWHAYMLTLYTL